MMARRFDITIFGATGFTGQWIAVALARALTGSKNNFAIAGRDSSKLQAVISRVQGEIGYKEPIGVIQADAKDDNSLVRDALMPPARFKAS